ncbi:MAG: cbb3-type cytochrome oxidase assembly protein CcoS [Daejeonella sp.]|uniref:cbb3-type cytochrome oxidase assembly protein CcoS n=1 Tax=Daejeonella sp. TaxID=2805397 RepID=UPI003C77B98A
MNILYFLIACSILIALLFLYAFFWSMKDGQNDDMETPAMRILFDDDKPEENGKSKD